MSYSFSIDKVSKDLVLYYLNTSISKDEMYNSYNRAMVFNQPVIFELNDYYGICGVELCLYLADNSLFSITDMILHCDYSYVYFLTRRLNMIFSNNYNEYCFIADDFNLSINIDVESDLSSYNKLYYISNDRLMYNIDYQGRFVDIISFNTVRNIYYDITIKDYITLINCNAYCNNNIQILLSYNELDDTEKDIINLVSIYRKLGKKQRFIILNESRYRYNYSKLCGLLSINNLKTESDLLIYYKSPYVLEELAVYKDYLSRHFDEILTSRV